jgi:hypothetical protein
MAKLTAAQANILANQFLGLAQAVGDYRFSNWDKLSKNDNQKLGNLQWSILNLGEDILALSTTLVMDEVKDSLTTISDITLQIKATITKLSNIQKAINVAASVVTLGSAIISKNPQSIIKGIDSLKEAWKA